jgi:dimeric dUTPase (all-alpha-NTP-PPase superfamily)
MEIKELLTMQKAFDRYLAAKHIGKSSNEKLDNWNRSALDKKLLALSVEVGELANATRCFKYWSTKEDEGKERMLDEYADVLHFLLSVANSLQFTSEDIEHAYIRKHSENYRRQAEGY